ncbi:hypothetical protein QN397_24940 [Variovorax sp. RTB1]|uniref:hypothetical protein n=1 Tax=Variovorax sp. RTB1 TaxID=3048631 RepID=UPI002B23A909|nr:hypothetical protein [Variovorax sp. RTB1]MEB0114531.1 hypothetical protein [Variovorax sp. RTB1]
MTKAEKNVERAQCLAQYKTIVGLQREVMVCTLLSVKLQRDMFTSNREVLAVHESGVALSERSIAVVRGFLPTAPAEELIALLRRCVSTEATHETLMEMIAGNAAAKAQFEATSVKVRLVAERLEAMESSPAAI